MERWDRERLKRTWVTRWAFGLAFLVLLVPTVSQATNGLNLIGSGGISSALAGADTAVATDFSAMNTNPAGLTQIPGTHTGFSLSMLKAELRLRNSTNDKDGENQPVVIPNTGIVHRLSGMPITVGIGFFTVGGTTSDFRDLQVAHFGPGGVFGGTVDKQGTQLRSYKLTPSIAYQVTDALSIGASLAVSYADVSLAIIPNTPGAQGQAFGFETTGKCNRANGLALPNASCGYSVGFTPKFGAMYKINDMVTAGIAYTMPTPSTFDHGQLTKNYLGIGTSTFDFKAFGFKWAQDVAVGVAVRPTSRLLIATKFQWINWDKALNNVVVEATNGSNPLVRTDTFVLNYQWKDQYVAALGISYDVTDSFTVRGGYNYGNNPVPKTTLDPINANIVEQHIVGAFQYRATQAFAFEMWTTYAIQKSETYNSTLFGPNTRLDVGGYDVGITLTYRN